MTINVPNPNPSYRRAGPSPTYLLPMPKGTADGLLSYTPPTVATTPYLTGERRLVTLFVKTGQIVSNSIENFNGHRHQRPFYDAQAGIKESQ